MEYRDKQMNFRVTESEYEVIRKRMEITGIKSPSAYLRKMAMNGYIIQMDLTDVKEMIRLLRINANNLNQYAKKANECGSVYLEDIRDLQEQQKGLWEEMRKILKMLSNLEAK